MDDIAVYVQEKDFDFKWKITSGMKIVGIGNVSTVLANKTTKNSSVVGNSEIYVLYISTLFETIICSASI